MEFSDTSDNNVVDKWGEQSQDIFRVLISSTYKNSLKIQTYTYKKLGKKKNRKRWVDTTNDESKMNDDSSQNVDKKVRRKKKRTGTCT